MNHVSKPAARTADLTVILSTDEKDAFRSKCAQIGARCSSQARRILNAWNPIQAPANGKPGHRKKEYPRHTHVGFNFPNRASHGGAPRPSRF